MLTSLIIKATIREGDKSPRTLQWQYSALDLLVFLQQVLPGVEGSDYDDNIEVVSIGNGNKGQPFKPRSAQNWFYVAKDKGSGRFPMVIDGPAWLKVGGRYIAVNPKNLYSSDWGTAGLSQVLKDPTYPTLRQKIADWKLLSQSNTDKELCKKFYQVARRENVTNMPEFLPVLVVVLLVSEVARNHTAFLTNLMATDLIGVGASVPTATGSIKWTWENAIWMVNACPDCNETGTVQCSGCSGYGRVTLSCRFCTDGIFRAGLKCDRCNGSGRYGYNGKFACNKCTGSGWYRTPVFCNKCDGHGNVIVDCTRCHTHGIVECTRCNGRGGGAVFDEFDPMGYDDETISGGGQALQNGLLPMSHTGSAFGSAFRLSNDKDGKDEQFYPTLKGKKDKLSKAPSPLTVVRRKEATVLIQWLTLAIPQVDEIEFTKVEETVNNSGGKSGGESVTVQNNVDVKVKIEPQMGLLDMDVSSIDFETVYDKLEAMALDSDFGMPKATSDTNSLVKAHVLKHILHIMQLRVDMISSLLS